MENLQGDKKLAHSAQMYHYQHQKQQIIAMENRNAELNHDDENDSDDNENDFTVYGEQNKKSMILSSLLTQFLS